MDNQYILSTKEVSIAAPLLAYCIQREEVGEGFVPIYGGRPNHDGQLPVPATCGAPFLHFRDGGCYHKGGSPNVDCRCGYYAYSTLVAAIRSGEYVTYKPLSIFLCILWGRIITERVTLDDSSSPLFHDRLYRAEYRLLITEVRRNARA